MTVHNERRWSKLAFVLLLCSLFSRTMTAGVIIRERKEQVYP